MTAVEELSETDLLIVRGALDKMGPGDVFRFREIHEAALRSLRPRLASIQRAVAMHEASLSLIEETSR